MKKISVIDLGSNSAKLTVAAVDNHSYSEMHNSIAYVRLSEGLSDESNSLKSEPVLRTVAAIKEFADKSSSLGAEKIYILATEAVRRADNSEWFAEIVRQFTGCELTILTGEQEVFYDCVSISSETGLSDFTVIDTGGGSTEIALYKCGRVCNFISLPWGAVTLTSTFGNGVSIGIQEYEKTASHIADGLSSISWLSECAGLPLVGVGGSVRIFNKLSSDLNLSEFLRKIIIMSVEERIEFGIPRDRADIITGGLMPAHMLLLTLDTDDILVSDANIRDGFIKACVLNQ